MGDVANLISALAATGALVIAVLAYVVSKRADDRIKVVAKTQVYLALRSRFLEVLEQLPPSYADPDWEPRTAEEVASATRYWQHTFDEWYVSRKLDPALHAMLRESLERVELIDRIAFAAWLELCRLHDSGTEDRFVEALARSAAIRQELSSRVS